MEDKTYELIEKLYNRMEERFNEQDSKIDSVKTELKQDINRVELNMVRMEHESALKFGAVFDGLTANTEAISELKTGLMANTEAVNVLKLEVKSLKKEVENHEIKLKLVK